MKDQTPPLDTQEYLDLIWKDVDAQEKWEGESFSSHTQSGHADISR